MNNSVNRGVTVYGVEATEFVSLDENLLSYLMNPLPGQEQHVPYGVLCLVEYFSRNTDNLAGLRVGHHPAYGYFILIATEDLQDPEVEHYAIFWTDLHDAKASV